jgi:hypothetical protein
VKLLIPDHRAIDNVVVRGRGRVEGISLNHGIWTSVNVWMV